jgi:integrase
VSPHGFRHYVAGALLESGVDPRVVSDQLGHESLSFTYARYGQHIRDHGGDQAAQAMQAILGGSE